MLETVGTPRTKMKVCAVGEEAVGKTSLIRRFVADVFEEDYIRTIGTLISKRTLEIGRGNSAPVTVDVVIWDIMGRQGFMDLLKEAYFYRARGVFAVLDLTRRYTLENLHGWLRGVYNAVGHIPVVILANKADLRKASEVSQEEVETLAGAYDCPYFPTSAKTGDNVGESFEALIRLCLEHRPRHLPYAEPGEAYSEDADASHLFIGR